jgi:hypothetical protein
VAKRALLFAISKQIIPACDAQYRPVSRGWFAIWFAIRGLKPLRKGRRPKPTRQSPLPSKCGNLAMLLAMRRTSSRADLRRTIAPHQCGGLGLLRAGL